MTGNVKIKELHCLAVNSATSGLHAAIEACGVKAGDLVLVPTNTFTSTAEVVRYLGAFPVFVDSAPGGFHMDPNKLEDTLKRLAKGQPPYPRGVGPTGKAAAVMPVHYGGLCRDMDAILEIARRYDLKVIEDAAHSFPSRLQDGRFAGTLGDAGVFSFYATKTLTTGEGGMVVCKDEAMARRISIMRSHGIDRSVWNRYTDARASWYYEVVEAGYKYNLPDLLAAVGRIQLKRAWDLLAARRKIAARYDEAFGVREEFVLPPSGDGDARHLYPIRLAAGKWKTGRGEVIGMLQEQGVGVSVHFIPLHTMPYYRNLFALEKNDLPEACKSFEQEISLPIWPGMTDAQVERVIRVLCLLAGNQ